VLVRITYMSVGFFNFISIHRELRVNTFYGREKELLIAFKNLLKTHFNKATHFFYAHNGKKFDSPFNAKRIIIRGIKLLGNLNIYNKKNWEATHLVTLHFWCFGDYKDNNFLYLMAYVIVIPSLKNNIDCSKVTSIYYKLNKIDRIAIYCKKKLINIAKVFLIMSFERLLVDTEIIY